MASKEEPEIKPEINKEKVRNKAFDDIESEYGSSVIANTNDKIEVIPTGSIGLDFVTGCGGYPRGRIVELYGRASSGKSLLSLLAIAQVQKMGGYAVLVDCENAFYTKWAQKHHVDPSKNLKIFQPDNGEQAFNIVEKVVRTGAVDLVVVDSTAALVPMSIVNSNMEDKKIADQARLISMGLQKLTPLICKTKTVLMFIDQVRVAIGTYGNPEKATGGAALEFYSSQRFKVSKKEVIEDADKKVIGYRIKVKNFKNKLAPPLQETEFDLYYDTGIDIQSEIFYNALKYGVLKLEGKTYSYKDLKWVGQDKCKEAIKGDDKLQKGLVIELDKVKKSLI